MQAIDDVNHPYGKRDAQWVVSVAGNRARRLWCCEEEVSSRVMVGRKSWFERVSTRNYFVRDVRVRYPPCDSS
jgi:hypothetical protein